MTRALTEVGTRAHLSIHKNAPDNLCAAFGWRGYVDTDLKFSEFFSENHTIAARFMIQYPRSYQAPILSLNGEGDYTVAVASYGGVKPERLLVTIGGKTYHYPMAGKLAPEKWHWLALVRDDSRLRLYLDGVLIKPDDSYTEIGIYIPDGTLRLGRKQSGDAQFYGLIDDVAVFNSALNQKTLKSYYNESPQLRGDEASLVAAYLFDQTPEAGSYAKAARRRVSFGTPATQIKISSIRDNKQDARLLPVPFNSTEVLLPFAPGQAWKVIQGYGHELSHNGGGCFAWDFERVDGPTPEQPVYACAAGRVAAVSDNNDPEPIDAISKDNFNYLQMEMAPGEVVTYLHLKNGSLIQALEKFAPASFPASFTPFPIAAGTQIGRVGNTWLKEQPNNWHLHFAGTPYVNSPVSIPLAFSDYAVYDPKSKSWQRVERGVPLQNQIVRRIK
jgi:murein DD-endopeptidase MepM/ murein hydrolase activator NlpD